MSQARRTIVRTCRACGCTDLRACPGGCTWALEDIETPTGICSTCAVALHFHPALLATVGFDEDPAADQVLEPLGFNRDFSPIARTR